MKPNKVDLLAVVVLGVVALLGLGKCAAALAFPPPNQPSYPYGEYNNLVPHVAETGELTWQAVDQYGWPAWHDVVAQSLDTGSPYQFSLGNVLGPFISVREATGTPDIQEIAVTTDYVEAKCGAGFAVACVYLLNPRPVPAYFKAAAMITYIFSGQAAVVEHETFHPAGQACDQYQGGCDPTSNLPVQCLGNPETLMDCGLAARFPQPFDIQTFRRAYVAGPASASLVPELNAIFYSAPGPTPARTINTQTRAAVFIETPLQPLTFAGFYDVGYGSIPGRGGPDCNTTYGFCWVNVPIFKCSSYYVATESLNRITWGGQNMTLAGRTSCF